MPRHDYELVIRLVIAPVAVPLKSACGIGDDVHDGLSFHIWTLSECPYGGVEFPGLIPGVAYFIIVLSTLAGS